MTQPWYAPLRQIQSKGARAERPGSLAGLAAARRIHEGQFFTPDGVARLMWAAAQSVVSNTTDWRKVSILDNSVGSGRLLQFAHPEKHAIYGVDVDAGAIEVLSAAADAAGFEYEFHALSMDSINPENFDLALINPPFSISLQSPWIKPYPCTTYGKFGPATGAISHAYSLHQALEAARIVVALLPSTFAADVIEDSSANPRLQAVYHLPASAFRDEGTEVRTTILVFGDIEHAGPIAQFTVSDIEAARVAPVRVHYPLTKSRPLLKPRSVNSDVPSITLAVTGDKTVRVHHDGRRIGLGFACGLTQAMVMNAVLKESVEAYQPTGGFRHKYPAGVIFTGQGVLDLEVHLAQPDPLSSFDAFIASINATGAKALVHRGLREHLARRWRDSLRQRMPIRHTVYQPAGYKDVTPDFILGRAFNTHMLNPNDWFSPVIKAGVQIRFSRTETGAYQADLSGSPLTLSLHELRARFDTGEAASTDIGGWHTVHGGLGVRYPGLEAGYRARARALGVDQWLSWGFQLTDAIECLMKPRGCVIAWEQALGKARLSAAMVLLAGVKHGLVVVEPYLVPEMMIELRALGLPAESWQVITTPAAARALRTINIITYDRLRSKVGDAKHLCFSHLLRRRIGLLVADEGEVLCNPNSLQSRALAHVSAKRRYVLTGSPIANYPRDALPVLNFVAGDGTAAQPYGARRAFLEPRLINSMAYAERGVDRFRDSFVTTEWISQEFSDTLLDGAKREIPKIANVDSYRAMLAPHVKRRLVKEPDVSRHLRLPEPKVTTHRIEWDTKHLAHYLRVAEEFSSWYLDQRKDEGAASCNLVAILARIQAVEFAANFPQHKNQKFGTYGPLTSKQRFAIERIAQAAADGHKIIVYAHHPGLLNLLARNLEALHGIDGVLFHGERTIKARTKDLNERFRYGDAPVLFAGIQVCQAGLNIPQADTVYFYDRDWGFKPEYQAQARVLRVQQTREVSVERWHLNGAIDEYQDQLVSFKKDAFHAGLDWATPEKDDVEFLHQDTILHRFCEHFAEIKGIEPREIRQALAA